MLRDEMINKNRFDEIDVYGIVAVIGVMDELFCNVTVVGECRAWWIELSDYRSELLVFPMCDTPVIHFYFVYFLFDIFKICANIWIVE